MIKRISLVLSVCLSVLFSLSTGAEPYMSNKDKDKYLIWVDKLGQGDAEGKCWGGGCRAALAVGPNGCWAKYPDMSLSRAKQQALKKCNTDCSTNDCQIMDIDGGSAFIKKVDSRVSSSTAKPSTTRASTDSLGEKPLEELFPRKAVFIDFEGQNLYVELVLKERGLFLIGRRELGSSSDGRFRCRSDGKLLANPAQIKSWSDYRVNTMCTIFLNGGYGQVNRDLIGTIDQIKIKHPEPSSTQTVVFRFLGPSDYALFLQARDNNLGQNAFGTDEFAEALEASNSPGKTSMAGDDPAIEQEFWKSVEDSDDVDMYMAYLESYPDGQFASLARLNITRLEKSEEKSPAIELEFWKTIKDSDDSEMFQAYLDEYPNGKFAPLARLKIKKLKSN